MLISIYCDLFRQKEIKFTDGLNVVLGGPKANNSIGKSTLLQIIDYCFGGETYCSKSDNDIKKNIGDHIIHFSFKFGNDFFFFSRDTSNPTEVIEYDKNWDKIRELSLNDFNLFLKSKYFPNCSDELSFRSIVSRFMRVAGKENIHEDKPLKGHNSDSDSNGVNVLEELFGFFEELKKLKKQIKLLKEEKKARESAKKFNIISNKIKNKKDYNNAIKEKESIIHEKEEIFKEGNIKHFDGDAAFSDESIELKIQLENLLKQLSRLKYRKKKLEKTFEKKDVISFDNLEELSLFFPEVNIKHLSEINEFHNKIVTIITGEIEEELKKINSDYDSIQEQTQFLQEKLHNLNIPTYISPDVMKAASEKERELHEISTSITNYEYEIKMKENIKELKSSLADKETAISENINNAINQEMERLSNSINIEKRYSPTFTIKSNDKYVFETPNDTGTGSKYKNLIIFDLSVLSLSDLPVLIHDSIVFKNIGDEPVINIFKEYALSNKQVFIAIDKINDYHDTEIINLLKSKCVIELDDNKELFGRSWGKIEK